MALRRTVLVLLGLVGSVLATGVLYISADERFTSGGFDRNTVGNENTEFLNETISFPISIPDTTLIAQQLSAYEGPYLEDGTDREVVNVAALHLYNSGDRVVLKTRIELVWNGGYYLFEGDYIPPGETVVLLERSASPYRQGEYLSCKGWQQNATADEQQEITVRDMAIGTLAVTNRSQLTAQNVCIYYKAWLSPPGIYVGGITYMVQIPVLLPGQTKNLYPPHYAYEYSKVVFVSAELIPLTNETVN